MSAVAALLLAGCTANGIPVTGAGGPTASEGQSETSITVGSSGGQDVVVLTYNDETGDESTIQYTANSRTVLAGASLFGWSWSTDGGNTWTYGGKVQPPPGWPILWGDPASTTSRNNRSYVFISNLAVPAANYPPGGVLSSGGDSGFYSALGGACIARSSNGGKSFAIAQCVTNDHHFYDGGSMASGPDGTIYAAYVDVATNQIDVWRSPNETGTFALMPPPFPGMTMTTHPRLRVDADGDTLYVAARAENGQVYITRFVGQAWAAPMPASFPMEWYPTINLSDRILRTGPQFSFDVATPSAAGNDEVRLVYTAFDSTHQRYELKGTRCPLDLSNCFDVPLWATTNDNFTTLQGDQFDPTVQAWQGFIGLPPEWKLTYLSRQDDPQGNTVTVQQGNLAVLPNLTPILIPFRLVAGHLVCPDLRGYWGDYDALQLVGFSGSAPTFLDAFTDSSSGCTARSEYNSANVHVSAVAFQ